MDIYDYSVQNSRRTKPKRVSFKGQLLAQRIKVFADENKAAASKPQFDEYLGQMQRLSTPDLVKFMRAFHKKESIIELICDEVGSSKDDRKKACMRVFDTLVYRAEKSGLDVGNIRDEFWRELCTQFHTWGTVNTKNLDKMVNQVVSQLEGRGELTRKDFKKIRRTPRASGRTQTNKIIERRLNRAYEAFGERVDENGRMVRTDRNGVLYNGQLQKDGIAADIADGISRIWGSDNTATRVRRDLRLAASQLRELQAAQKQGSKAYAAKFQEIFGVAYDYGNIVAYQKAERNYINATQANETEQMFNRYCRNLLRDTPLQSECFGMRAIEDVYEREFNSLARMINNGAAYLNNLLKKEGVFYGSLESKYAVLQREARRISMDLHNRTIEAGGGRCYADVQLRYENAYVAAFGRENDIMRRVNDYNVSQEIGAVAVKLASMTIPPTVVDMAGANIASISMTAAGSVFGVELFDRFTTGKSLATLRAEGFSSYLKTASNDTDWGELLRDVVVVGGSLRVGGVIAKGIDVSITGSQSLREVLGQFAGSFLVTDGVDSVRDGLLTVDGQTFSILLSPTGKIVAIKKGSEAYLASIPKTTRGDGGKSK